VLSLADRPLFLAVVFPALRRACAVSDQKMIRYTGLLSYHLRAVTFVPASLLWSSAPHPNFFIPSSVFRLQPGSLDILTVPNAKIPIYLRAHMRLKDVNQLSMNTL